MCDVIKLNPFVLHFYGYYNTLNYAIFFLNVYVNVSTFFGLTLQPYYVNKNIKHDVIWNVSSKQLR